MRNPLRVLAALAALAKHHSTGRRESTLPRYALDGDVYVSTPSGIQRRTPKRDKSIFGRQWRKFRRQVGRANAHMYLQALAARKTVHK